MQDNQPEEEMKSEEKEEPSPLKQVEQVEEPVAQLEEESEVKKRNLNDQSMEDEAPSALTQENFFTKNFDEEQSDEVLLG